MTITKERKQELIHEFKRQDSDTGSPEVQIAILTTRINSLTEHMRTHHQGLRHAARPVGDGQPPAPVVGLPPQA